MRYQKMCFTAERIIPVQIGFSAFQFNRDNNSYSAKVYTFYIFPRTFGNLNNFFIFNSNSLEFLSAHNFDFNKVNFNTVFFFFEEIMFFFSLYMKEFLF